MEYFDWLEQEAEEQRREERQARVQRFLPQNMSAGLLLWLESSDEEEDDNETDSDDGREA